MRQDRRLVGPPADLPSVRADPLLRLLAEPAREQARARVEPSGGGVGGAWRALALLLPRRCVRGVLNGCDEGTPRSQRPPNLLRFEANPGSAISACAAFPRHSIRHMTIIL